MKPLILHATTVFMGFFAIMNPIANVPIFLGLTSDIDKQTTKTVAVSPLFWPLESLSFFPLQGN